MNVIIVITIVSFFCIRRILKLPLSALQDLIEVMKSELRGDFEEVTLGLLMAPTEYDVYCLRDATKGLGTQEAALIGILCTRNSQVWLEKT